jgi:hypothetical protein
MKIQIQVFNFGSNRPIVSNMGLVIGFYEATAMKAMMLTIYIYQESEQLEPRKAFRATLTNFFARLFLSLSFVFRVAVPRLLVSAVFHIKVHIINTFKLNRDKDFLKKLTNVVELYLNPSDEALVLCVD